MHEVVKRDARQSVEELSEQLSAAREGNRLYNADGDANNRREVISAEVAQAIDMLSLSFPSFAAGDDVTVRAGRVNLDNLEEVAGVARRYLRACERSGSVPLFSALCCALGYSRKHVYGIMRSRSNKVTDFLSVMQTLFASVLQQVGLSRRCSEAVSIFLLKNSGQGYSDKQELVIDGNRSVDRFSSGDPEEIARKYLAGMPPVEEDRRETI